jgi:hypothetical protein
MGGGAEGWADGPWAEATRKSRGSKQAPLLFPKSPAVLSGPVTPAGYLPAVPLCPSAHPLSQLGSFAT